MSTEKLPKTVTMPKLPDTRNDARELKESGADDLAMMYRETESQMDGTTLHVPVDAYKEHAVMSGAMAELKGGKIRVMAAWKGWRDEILGKENLYFTKEKDSEKFQWREIQYETATLTNGSSVTIPKLDIDKTSGKREIVTKNEGYESSLPGLDTASFKISGDKITWQISGSDVEEELSDLIIGEKTRKNLLDYLKANGANKSFKAYYDFTFDGYEKTLATIDDADTDDKTTLDLQELFDLEGQTLAGVLQTIIVNGYLKTADQVDFKSGQVTFVKDTANNTSAKQLARDALNTICARNWVSDYDSTKNFSDHYADPMGRGLAMFFYGEYANVAADWAWGAYRVLGGGGKQDITPLTGLKQQNSDVPLFVSDLEKEFKRQEKLNLSPKAFLYFVVVKDGRGGTKLQLLTREELLPGAEKKIPMPILDSQTLASIPLDVNLVPGVEELQKYINTNGLSNVHYSDPVMGIEANYAIHADERYIFTSQVQGGEEVLILRVPTCNRDMSTGTIQQGSVQETAPLGYMTVDEASLVSAFIGNVDPQGKSMMMSRVGEEGQEIYNPLTRKTEFSFGYNLSILRSNVPEFVPQTIRALVESGYPIELPENANDKQVIDAAIKFFIDGWKTKKDFKWYLPGEDGWIPDPWTNEYYEFSNERAWADPQGLTEEIEIIHDDGTREKTARPKTLKIGGIDVPRKRAAYLVYMFLAYMGETKEFGLTAAEMRDWQAGLNQKAIDSGQSLTILSTLMSLVVFGGLQAWGIREQRKLMKEAQNMGVNDKNDREEIAKLMSDPNYTPSFVTPLVDLSGGKDANPYFATPERDQQIRMLMRSLTGETGYSAAFITGDSGVGKTEMVKEAQRLLWLPRQEAIAAGVPEELIGKTIYNVDPSAMGANIKFIGTFEGKVALLKMFARRRNAILLFDEAKMYVDMGKSGDGDGSKSGNTLFELCLQDFSNRSLRAIFATTTLEFKRYFEPNPDLKAFLRRVKAIELKAYDAESVKIAMASIYASLLEGQQVIRFDMDGARQTKVQKPDGSEENILIPRIIDEIVDAVSGTDQIRDNPNLLMDMSIKKLKEICDGALTDFSNGRLSFILTENIDGKLPILIKRKISLNADIKGLETELTPLKDEFNRKGRVLGYNVPVYSRMARKAPSAKIQELESLIASKKDELKEIEDRITEISGDPNLIPIYEDRLKGVQDSINSNQNLLDTATMTPSQRQAAMQEFKNFFDEPSGTYFFTISEIHALNDQIRALLSERETLLRPVMADLATLPSSKWDECIFEKLGSVAKNRYEEIERELSGTDGFVAKVSTVEESNSQILQQYELLLYKSGQKQLSSLEVSRLKKNIEGLNKKKIKYEEKLAQLNQAKIHIQPGRPQGIVMGSLAFRHYYPKTVTQQDVKPEIAQAGEVEAILDRLLGQYGLTREQIGYSASYSRRQSSVESDEVARVLSIKRALAYIENYLKQGYDIRFTPRNKNPIAGEQSRVMIIENFLREVFSQGSVDPDTFVLFQAQLEGRDNLVSTGGSGVPPVPLPASLGGTGPSAPPPGSVLPTVAPASSAPADPENTVTNPGGTLPRNPSPQNVPKVE